MSKASYFVPENEQKDSIKERLSPSGKYKLVTSRFATSPGCWNYSQGKVYRVGSDEPIAVIQRNYGAFPHSWVEDHPNGHSYLIAGEDYQGQTVVELDTGKRRNYLPKEAGKGHGFCWSEHRFVGSVLIVCGCYWACPYDFKFFDFSDPMSGWPELEMVDSNGKAAWASEDDRWPTVEPDGIIKCYQTHSEEDVEEDDETPSAEEKPKKELPLASVRTFTRKGQQLVLTDEWVSDREKEIRAANEEAERKYNEWMASFRATDPLYLKQLEIDKDPTFSVSGYYSVGWTYKEWCLEFTGNEKRFCRRIAEGSKNPNKITIDLEWATETGPIKLVVFQDGKTSHNKFFPHTVEAMGEAIAYAKKAIEEGVS